MSGTFAAMEDTSAIAPENPPPLRRKRPWVAALLNMGLLGLGQAYAGYPWRGLFLHAASWALAFSGIAMFLHGPLIVAVFPTLLVLLLGAYGVVDAWRCGRSAVTPHPFGHRDRWYTYAAIAVLVIVPDAVGDSMVRSRIQAFRIPAGSMEPTLLIGDRFLVDKTVYDTQGPERGDVIVFPFPEDPSKNFVKRIVGLPGETIEIRDKKVLIDGEPLNEPYVFFADGPQSRGASPRDTMEAAIIPDHHYFVLGDNRDRSYDSRYWGPIAEEEIIGRVRVLYFSANAEDGVRWRRIGLEIQ